ncbi:hypothetical protein jhhlp_003577 [Lomentospora prolificans]|uniref:F-box domain-containing protein n=1 Tax=Lomentospora prolificans TaxID=41688 RepID=A0A2N3N975_9PEZI|nr:hypothetical protein jhhlp_003577 [Lomentospora prolificans]
MVYLEELPTVLLLEIFGWLSPTDLGVLLRVCRRFCGIVSTHGSLYRDVYLTFLDAPQHRHVNWMQDVRDICKLQKICSREYSKKDEDLVHVCSTILKLLKSAKPRDGEKSARQVPTHLPSYNVEFLSSLFEDEKKLRKYMCRSSIYHGTSIGPHSRGSSNDPLVQLSAKLHCHYGKPVEDPIIPAVASIGEPYDFACAKVYNLRHYTAESFWGPFKDDGSGEVDWEKVEASIVVMAVKTSRDKASLWTMPWREPFAGAYPQSYVSPHPRKELEPLDPTDPYGISGTWMRLVCFLNWGDLQMFNFTRRPETLRSNLKSLFWCQGVSHMVMNLKVTAIEDPSPDDSPDLPVVHFSGFSRHLYHPNDPDISSDIEGTCRLTKEGEVRWTTVSTVNANPRWKTECVQIGGVRAAGPVVGNWFSADYDARGPVGPLAFWKLSDREVWDVESKDVFPKVLANVFDRAFRPMTG